MAAISNICSVYAVKEISRRLEIREISDDQFREMFNPQFVRKYIQGEGAPFFMIGASETLLKKMLDFDPHFLSHPSTPKGFNKIENLLDALNKLILFGNWYESNRHRIHPTTLAADSFFRLLRMSESLYHTMIKKDRNESAALVLELADGWIKRSSYPTIDELASKVAKYYISVEDKPDENAFKDQMRKKFGFSYRVLV